jgi:TonB-linked SusC/RagA family outer membrane protein
MINMNIDSASKKTKNSQVFDKKASKARLSKFLNPGSLLMVNDWFKNESNAVFGVFFQRLNMIFLRRLSAIIALGLIVQGAFSQEKIAGTIYDARGYIISDVSVSDAESGDTLSLSGESGTFEFEASGVTSLIFDKEGYKPITLFTSEVSGKPFIILEEDPLEQSMAVAYGKQKRRNSTSAISSVSGSEVYKTPVPTLSNGLMGRIPGLTVMQESGEPGYDEPSMLIRGKATYNNSDYLVYVDGFEASFEQLSALEIENISILKDAAALALFGIRGANGVIWVTTKHGEEGRTKIQFNTRYGFQSPTKLPDFLNSYDYSRLYNEAMINDYGEGAEVYSDEALQAYKNHTNPYLYPDVNWYDEVLKKNTPIYDANLTFTGGNKTVKYFLLLGYMRNQGLYANTDKDQEINSNADFKRYNFRSNVDLKISDIFDASVKLGGRLEDRSFPNFNGPSLWNNMANYPSNIYPVKNANGSWGGNSTYPDNPVASVLAKGYDSTHDREVQATFQLSENLDRILPGLGFFEIVSFSNFFRGNYDKNKDYARFMPYLGVNDEGEEEIMYNQYLESTDFSINEWSNRQWHRTNFEFGMNYDLAFGDHGVSSMVMFHRDKYIVDGNNVPYAHQGIKGRLNYMYKDRYIAEFGFSYNGSENFASGERYGFFPAVSGAWIISDERFMSGLKNVDFLKLRSSYGILGNDNLGIDRFPYEQNYYTEGGYHFGNNGNNWKDALIEGRMGNADVSWEKSHKFNIGLDACFFGKFDATLDFFHEKRTDIIDTRSSTIMDYIGIGLPYENIGKVTNKGIEASLMFSDNIGDFSYFAQTNFSFARNTIDYKDEVWSESYLYRTGHSVDQKFGLEAIGFFDSWDEINDADTPKQLFGSVQPGDIRYKDRNGDGFITEDDETPIGHGEIPEYTYSFDIGASYKGFDLELFFQGVGNRSVYREGSYVWAFVENSKAAPNALGRWTEATKGTATYPRLTTIANENNYRTSTFWMENGAFLRLRNIELGYTLPHMLAKRLGIAKARIFVNGINQITWDHVENSDPEVLSGYPLMKSWNMGLSVNF